MKKIKISLLSLALAAISNTTQAQVTTNLTLGNPKALALGNAVTADPPGIDSIHFNPAGLGKIKGNIFQVKVLAASIGSEAKFGERAPEVSAQLNKNPLQDRDIGAFTDKIIGTTSRTSNPILMLPGAGLTKIPAFVLPFGGFAINPPDTGITFADSFYSPDGIGYTRDKNDPGVYQGDQAAMVRLTYLSPSVGFELMKNLYVGASIGVSWQGVGFDLEMRAPTFVTYAAKDITARLPDQACSLLPGLCNSLSPYDDLFHMNLQLTNALSPSINLGVLWDPTPYLSFGAVYQSESRAELKGDYRLDYTQRWQNFFSKIAFVTAPFGLSVGKAVDKGTATMEWTEPQHFSMGTSVRIIPKFKLNFDIKWADYGVWDNFDIKFDQGIDFLKFGAVIQPANAKPQELILPRHYQSVWSWAVGGEYQLDNRLALRAGFEPRRSAIPPNKTDILIPIADANLYTVGFGFQLSEDELIEGAFGYLTSKYRISNAPGKQSSNFNLWEDDLNNAIYNPYMGLSAKVDTKAYLFNLAYTSKF